MRRIIFALLFSLSLTACGIDTTGLSSLSSRTLKGPVGAIKVTEYADLQCPACKASHEQIIKPMLAEYGDRIQFEFKHFPLRRIHPFALAAAEASECAADQGKFWEFIDLAYAKQDLLSTAALPEWATELQLDLSLFERCTRSNIKEELILADYSEGEKLGVSGTPSFFVEGIRVERNNLEFLKAANDQALLKRAGQKL
mgnify:CR=1 FL=1